MRTNRTIGLLFGLCGFLILTVAEPVAARQDTLLADGWRFTQQDAPHAEKPGLDDCDWQAVSLPHNWGWEDAQLGKKYYRGPGEIIAVDNSDATSFEPFQVSERRAYNGKALVIVRSLKGKSGVNVVKAESPGLAAAEVKIKSVLPKFTISGKSIQGGWSLSAH